MNVPAHHSIYATNHISLYVNSLPYLCKMKVNFKPGQLLPTFDYTITILNKLKAQHSETKQDIWKKTVVKNCAWSSNLVRNIAGTAVSVGASYIVLRSIQDANLLYCDIYSIKFVTISENPFINNPDFQV